MRTFVKHPCGWTCAFVWVGGNQTAVVCVLRATFPAVVLRFRFSVFGWGRSHHLFRNGKFYGIL